MHYEVSVKFNKDFVDVDEGRKHITMGVRAKPIKGKANEEVIKKLADYFDVPKSNVRIIAGLRSKTKIIDIIKE